jgi:2-polyprenyl-3-methyl-5-hydroxy-6-metoxy-1,4-benzoquinol methylase
MYIVCNLCGQDNAKLLYRPRLSPGPVVCCQTCGLLYVNPIEDPERLAGNDHDKITDLVEPRLYKQFYLAEAEVKRNLYMDILGRIESVTGRAGTLLDVGSYLGLFMQAAESRGWRCKGIEPERDAWQYAVQELKLDVCLGTLRTCTFAPHSFDAIILLQVLEHVLDPRQTLEQIHGLLRPNGVLLVEVPNINCLSFRILGKRHRHFAEHHFTFFSAKTLTALLSQCGFRVVGACFPRRVISIRLLSFGLRMWYPSVYKLMAPIFSITPLQNSVLSLNLREVVSICAQVS